MKGMLSVAFELGNLFVLIKRFEIYFACIGWYHADLKHVNVTGNHRHLEYKKFFITNTI